LEKALLRVGVSVSKIVRKDTKLNRLHFYWERLIIFLCNGLNRKKLFMVSIANTGEDISSNPLVKEADIIHLHWINQGFLSLNNIKKLVELNKPIVWTMHDMWPCTGICHHARDCKRYQEKCGSCIFLDSKGNDLSTKIYNQKLSLYKLANITFVGCSQWLTNRAKQSRLLENKLVCSIPNPIDVSLFRQKGQKEVRNLLGLPLNKKLLLFGALNVTDRRKGIEYLITSLELLDRQDVELVVLGQVKENIRNMFSLPIHSIGYLSDELKIVDLYNAVDMFVTPSLEENLPNMIMESMACGTPCVGFRVGGIPEMIDHQVNGYVANYKDSKDLANGIQWVLEHKEPQTLSEACIKKVKENYCEEIVAKQYIDLYKRLLRDK